ncbi:MAG: tetratricopeptide repeat protein [Chitinophagales bacterium]
MTFDHFIKSKNSQLIIIMLSVLLLYGNTLFNQFALDDGMVILENKFVLQGINGIPDIITHDSFYGAIGNSENLNGGRYRPLSLISFAIENSLFGNSPLVYHLFNILLYLFTCVILLLLLRRFIFREHPLAAFIAAFLFTIHPIHTEVVANVKSRDEIFSLLFLLLTLYYLLEYAVNSGKPHQYILSILSYALALLSKENGFIFTAIIPITVYFFSEKKVSSLISQSIPFWVVAVFYLLLRTTVIDENQNEVTEVMDNPYLLASLPEKYASILFVLLRYLELLVWPHPLTYDYSYNQIPYSDFSSMQVWISVAIHLSMTVLIFTGLKKKSLPSWCIIFYLSGIFIISNLLINIGAPMAERFLFQASVPFLILLTEAARKVLEKWSAPSGSKMAAVALVLVLITMLSSYTVIIRNAVWKSNETLFLHDVKISSQSARANTYAGVALIKLCDQAKNNAMKRSYAEQAINYFKISSTIKPNYITTLLNEGVAYSRLDSVDGAEKIWSRARVVSPGNKNFVAYDKYLGESYYQLGMQEARNKNLPSCINYLEKSVLYDPKNAEAWYNLGGAYFTTQQYEKAKTCWQKTLQLNPKQQQAADGLRALGVPGT